MTPTPVPVIMGHTPVPQSGFDYSTSIGGFLTFGIAVVIILVGLWIIAFVDILKSSFTESSNKVVWLVVSLLLPFVGPLLYFAIGRKQAKPGTGISLKSAFTVLGLLIFFPLGVLLMWIWTKWPKWLKIVFTVFGVIDVAIRVLARIQ